MAPTLAHPTGVNFVDEHHRPVNSEASTYYGGEERFSRSRTYSAVRVSIAIGALFVLWLIGSPMPSRPPVLRTWIQP